MARSPRQAFVNTLGGGNTPLARLSTRDEVLMLMLLLSTACHSPAPVDSPVPTGPPPASAAVASDSENASEPPLAPNPTFSAADCVAATSRQPTGPLVLALTVTDPWLMVIGSDTPRVAVYADGSVIYTPATLKSAFTPYVIGKLDPDALAALLGHAAAALTSLEPSYSVSTWTDQPDNILVLSAGPRSKRATVYGNLAQAADRKATPPAFLAVFDELLSVDPRNSTPWLPGRVEVMLWSFDYAKSVGATWPADWPQPGGPDSFTHSEMSSVMVPAEHLPELVDLLRATGQRGALSVQGKKYSMALRLAFPTPPAQ